jgi:hypothetical protein
VGFLNRLPRRVHANPESGRAWWDLAFQQQVAGQLVNAQIEKQRVESKPAVNINAPLVNFAAEPSRDEVRMEFLASSGPAEIRVTPISSPRPPLHARTPAPRRRPRARRLGWSRKAWPPLACY